MSEPTEKKDELIEAATNLFAAKGFRGASIRDIAHACSTSISNIYHHFGNKEGLILAILERFSDDLLVDLRRVAASDVEPLDRFRMLITAHIRMAWDRTREGKILFLDEEHLTPEGHAINLRIQREVLDIYRKELKGLKERGLVRGKNVTVTAFNIFGVINWFLRWCRRDGPMTLEEVAEAIVDFAIHGALNIQDPDAG